jgi:hypothetical protein
MTHSIAALLAELGLKSTFVLAAAWTAARLVRRRPAEERHLVWVLALAGLLALPALAALGPNLELPIGRIVARAEIASSAALKFVSSGTHSTAAAAKSAAAKSGATGSGELGSGGPGSGGPDSDAAAAGGPRLSGTAPHGGAAGLLAGGGAAPTPLGHAFEALEALAAALPAGTAAFLTAVYASVALLLLA